MVSGDRATVAVDGRVLTLTSLDKVLYPADGTTKGEVIHYYVSVAPALLPQLSDRPVTRVRWPDGTAAGSFFEKNLPVSTPDWVASVTLDSPGSRRGTERITYPLVRDVATLIWLANLAALELHVPQWQVAGDGPEGQPGVPDRLVVDLDPGPPAGLAECAQVALLVREDLHAAGYADIVPVTSGSKGMQLYAASPPGAPRDDGDPDMFRREAQVLAERLARQHPKLVVASMTRSLRRGRVLLDWSQNNMAKTTICPYSLRGKGGTALAAAPRTWEEVEQGAGGGVFDQLRPTHVLHRLERDGDLMQPIAR